MQVRIGSILLYRSEHNFISVDFIVLLIEYMNYDKYIIITDYVIGPEFDSVKNNDIKLDKTDANFVGE